jgi:amino acid transporter
MPEDKPNVSRNKTGWLSYIFFKALLPIGIFVGIIVFAFGAVGLYEDREWLSLDLVFALAGPLLAGLCWIVLLKAPVDPESEASEESPSMNVGCALLIIALFGIKLARKTSSVGSFLKIGIPALLVFLIVVWLENKYFSEKGEPDTDDSEDPSTTAPQPTADPEATDPTPPEDE